VVDSAVGFAAAGHLSMFPVNQNGDCLMQSTFGTISSDPRRSSASTRLAITAHVAGPGTFFIADARRRADAIWDRAVETPDADCESRGSVFQRKLCN
jgi:hypothetical protein